MASIFSSIQLRRPRFNKFNLSHERKMSLQMGNLYPMYVEEIVPGDKFRVRSEIMLRFAPLLAPVMHRVNVFTHYFFVPNRLLWDEWEDFITGGRLGTAEPVPPRIRIGADTFAKFSVGSLADYLGLPVVGGDPDPNEIFISALPFRAYQLCYDEYYRDQNLEAALDISKASGTIPAGAELDKITELRVRAWEKDYFTSALPFAQRGGSVEVPLSDDPTVQTEAYRVSTGLPFTQSGDLTIGGSSNVLMTGSASEDGGVHLGAEGYGIDVNSLRRSVRLQEWLEKNARGGARYVEQILSHFGVRSSDARLQRPEYLGGGKTPVVISEVLSTFQDETGNPQGTMAGHGISFGTTNGFRRGFEEHGFVIGIMSVLPKTAYQQGIHRMFSRFDKFDYYWPEFAQIGEQEIKNKEIYYAADVSEPEGTFGYQSRYAEYKYGCSTVHGAFRGNLSFWHMGRIFASQPSLNDDFVKSDPTTRIFAVETGDHLYCQLYNRVDALRPMPYFGTPTI